MEALKEEIRKWFNETPHDMGKKEFETLIEIIETSLISKTEPVAEVPCSVGLSAEHTPSHIIVFEDNDQRLEPFWDKDVAQARLDALGDNWTCHLYKLVESR